MIIWRFLNPVEAYDLLSTKDEYLLKVNEFNLKLHKVASLEEYLEKLPASLYDWSDAQINNGMEVLSEVNQEIQALGLEINQEVGLILTDGEEMFHLEYTRGNAIVFPYACRDIFEKAAKSDLAGFRKTLVAHELFHVLSRMRPEIRTSLYKTFGFTEHEEDFLKEPYHDQIINPDALDHKWTADLWHKKEKREIKGFPLIREKNWGAFLEVTPEGLKEGAVKHTNLSKKIDSSLTGYLSHPEEISAEYFKIALCYPEKREHPRIQDFLKELAQLYPRSSSSAE